MENLFPRLPPLPPGGRVVYREVIETTRVPEVIPRLLGELTEAIDWIDGGCYICIEKFIGEANKALKRLSLPYRYEFRQENRIGSRVWVVHQSDPEVK